MESECAVFWKWSRMAAQSGIGGAPLQLLGAQCQLVRAVPRLELQATLPSRPCGALGVSPLRGSNACRPRGFRFAPL
jgi:hypothetical protein